MARTALVTGASRGIGRAIAQRLAAEGTTVAVHYGRDDQAAAETVAEIERDGGRAFPVRAELGRDGDVDAVFAGLESGLGGPVRLDILVVNAAIVGPTPISDLTAEEFDRVLAVNVKAPLFLIQRALPLIPDGGRIVAISSLVTRYAPPEIAYAMSKGAIDVMTRSLATTAGPRGITVNSVAPGLTDTDLMAPALAGSDRGERVAASTALGRIGRPDDIADVVAFLASERARWITGQIVDATGGQFLRPV